jgi:hypothetical protein
VRHLTGTCNQSNNRSLAALPRLSSCLSLLMKRVSGLGLIPPFAGGPLPLRATPFPRAATTRLVTFKPSPASKSCPGRKHKARETAGTVVN